MRILFLGDVVGISGCSKLMNNLMDEIKSKKIDFVIVNGENAASQGVGLTKEICLDFFNCGVDVITTGNHVWDQKEIMEYIDKEERLLRPKNLFEPAPGRGFNIYNTKENIKIGVLNLMGNGCMNPVKFLLLNTSSPTRSFTFSKYLTLTEKVIMNGLLVNSSTLTVISSS